MAVITSALIQALNTGFRKDFQSAYDQMAAVSHWSKIATEVPSSTTSNTYGWLSQMPRLREWVGDRVIKDIKEHGYQIINKSFEATVGVPRTAVEDDSVGMYRPVISGLGRSAAEFIDELVFSLLKNGHTSNCFDGQYFFDTDHPIYPNHDGTGTATVASNVTAGAGDAWYLLDTNNILKPLIWQNRKAAQLVSMTQDTDEKVFMSNEYRYGVDMRGNAGYAFWQLAHKSQAVLDEAGYSAARTAMMSLKADGGKSLNVRPNLLVVPPSLEGKARSLILKDKDAGNPWCGTCEILVSPWLL